MRTLSKIVMAVHFLAIIFHGWIFVNSGSGWALFNIFFNLAFYYYQLWLAFKPKKECPGPKQFAEIERIWITTHDGNFVTELGPPAKDEPINPEHTITFKL